MIRSITNRHVFPIILSMTTLSLVACGQTSTPTDAVEVSLVEKADVPLSAQAGATFRTTTKGCEKTVGVGQWWAVKADVTYGRSGSFGWIERIDNVRTEHTGFTLGVEETNAVTSAVITGAASGRISGSAVLKYGVPTPWGQVSWLSQSVNCAQSFSIY